MDWCACVDDNSCAAGLAALGGLLPRWAWTTVTFPPDTNLQVLAFESDTVLVYSLPQR